MLEPKILQNIGLTTTTIKMVYKNACIYDRRLTIIAYTDDVVITTEEPKKLTKELIRTAWKVGLHVNKEKTKYLILSKEQNWAKS